MAPKTGIQPTGKFEHLNKVTLTANMRHALMVEFEEQLVKPANIAVREKWERASEEAYKVFLTTLPPVVRKHAIEMRHNGKELNKGNIGTYLSRPQFGENEIGIVGPFDPKHAGMVRGRVVVPFRLLDVGRPWWGITYSNFRLAALSPAGMAALDSKQEVDELEGWTRKARADMELAVRGFRSLGKLLTAYPQFEPLVPKEWFNVIATGKEVLNAADTARINELFAKAKAFAKTK